MPIDRQVFQIFVRQTIALSSINYSYNLHYGSEILGDRINNLSFQCDR